MFEKINITLLILQEDCISSNIFLALIIAFLFCRLQALGKPVTDKFHLYKNTNLQN